MNSILCPGFCVTPPGHLDQQTRRKERRVYQIRWVWRRGYYSGVIPKEFHGVSLSVQQASTGYTMDRTYLDELCLTLVGSGWLALSVSLWFRFICKLYICQWVSVVLCAVSPVFFFLMCMSERRSGVQLISRLILLWPDHFCCFCVAR